MYARMMPLLPMSVLLLACGEPTQLTRPVPVKAEIPAHLRACADKSGTDPTKFQTRGDLLIGYGDERTLRMEVQECAREIIRLVDFQNKSSGLTEPEPPKLGGERE